VRALRHGMVASPDGSSSDPGSRATPCGDAIVQAGQEFGIRQVARDLSHELSRIGVDSVAASGESTPATR